MGTGNASLTASGVVQNLNAVSKIGGMAFSYIRRWMGIYVHSVEGIHAFKQPKKKRAISDVNTQARTKVTLRKGDDGILPYGYRGGLRKVEQHNILNLSISHILCPHEIIKRSTR